jgi:ComF family protein
MSSPCPNCLRQPVRWKRAVCVCDYGGAAADLVLRFKQPDNDWLARPLAALMLEAWQTKHPDSIHAVIPVPTSSKQFLHRGFNPAYQLGRHLAKHIHAPVHGSWVYKQNDTQQQHQLPRRDRLHNLTGSFAVLPRAKSSIQGKNILVIDDIMTTGATVNEMSHVLLGAGAAQVQVLVFARTPPAVTMAS